MSTPVINLTPEEQTLCNNVLRLLESGDTVTRFQAIGAIRDHVASQLAAKDAATTLLQGSIQRHINRADMPLNGPALSDNQAQAISQIVDRLNHLQEHAHHFIADIEADNAATLEDQRREVAADQRISVERALKREDIT